MELHPEDRQLLTYPTKFDQTVRLITSIEKVEEHVVLKKVEDTCHDGRISREKPESCLFDDAFVFM